MEEEPSGQEPGGNWIPSFCLAINRLLFRSDFAIIPLTKPTGQRFSYGNTTSSPSTRIEKISQYYLRRRNCSLSNCTFGPFCFFFTNARRCVRT